MKIAFTSPINNSQIPDTANILFNTNTNDDDSITQVEFYIDNKLIETSLTAPFNFNWQVSNADI